jgi:RimJ/RimL family protein N-acetyltransferase
MNPLPLAARLFLREMNADDAEQAFLLNNDPEVRRYNGAVPFSSLEAARQFLTTYPDYRINGFGRWAMIRKEDQAWLGWCGLKRLEDGEVDLGYCLHRSYWGQGYATEASVASVNWGFANLPIPKIIGRVHKENSASIKVLEKVGMIYWKTDVCEHDPEALIYRIERNGTWSTVLPQRSSE